MATKSLKDYFNFSQISNPAGGFTMASTTPAVLPQRPVQQLNRSVPSSLTQLSLPTPQPDLLTLPPNSPLTAAGPNPLRPSPSASPIFTPSTGGPSSAPVGPQGATGAAPASQVPLQYLKPDGSFKTPDEIAHDIGSTLATAHGNGDVGTLSLEQFGGGNKSAAQLEAEARRIGNTRNDIAVGETDPYKVASESGIAYTPAELSAIEKAYAGIYDPALDTAMAKVTAKQEQDRADAQNNQPFTLGKDQVRYDAQGNPIAVGLSGETTPGGSYVAGQNPIVDAYVKGSLDGTYKPGDIPDQYKDLVAQGRAQTAPQLSKSANDALSNIETLLSDPNALEYVTGGSNLNPITLLPGAQEAPARNLLNQLAGTLALQNRLQLKGSGAISDFEFRVLQQAASDLGVQANGTSNLSPAALRAGLEKLQLKLKVGETNLTDQDLLDLKAKGYTPEQIRDFSNAQSFNDVGNTTASKTTGLNRPQRNNNPGNVKSGGLADSLAVGRDEQGHLIFPDAQTGFKALTADLTAKINGGSSRLPANPTIAQLGKVYAEDPNWPVKVAKILGVTTDTHTQAVPLANLVKAVATQEGFYA